MMCVRHLYCWAEILLEGTSFTEWWFMLSSRSLLTRHMTPLFVKKEKKKKSLLNKSSSLWRNEMQHWAEFQCYFELPSHLPDVSVTVKRVPSAGCVEELQHQYLPVCRLTLKCRGLNGAVILILQDLFLFLFFIFYLFGFSLTSMSPNITASWWTLKYDHCINFGSLSSLFSLTRTWQNNFTRRRTFEI